MWDEHDDDWFDGFLAAMIWFFSGPIWLCILIILIVALILYIY